MCIEVDETPSMTIMSPLILFKFSSFLVSFLLLLSALYYCLESSVELLYSVVDDVNVGCGTECLLYCSY